MAYYDNPAVMQMKILQLFTAIIVSSMILLLFCLKAHF